MSPRAISFNSDTSYYRITKFVHFLSNADIIFVIFMTKIEAERQKPETKIKVVNPKNVPGICCQMVHTMELFVVPIFCNI